MQVFLFFALFIAILAILFAVQNVAPVVVSFIFWKFEGSLALVLLIALAAGALISFLASLPSNIRIRWAVRNQRKKISELEASLVEYKAKLEEALKKPPAEAEVKEMPTPLPEPKPKEE